MTLQPAQGGDEAPLMTTHTGIDNPADEEVAEYLLAGATVRPDTPTGQVLLAQAYLEHERPMCRCTPDGTAMYIARMGTRFIVKRMPDSGSLHSTRCGSYAPEEAYSQGAKSVHDGVGVEVSTGQAAGEDPRAARSGACSQIGSSGEVFADHRGEGLGHVGGVGAQADGHARAGVVDGVFVSSPRGPRVTV